MGFLSIIGKLFILLVVAVVLSPNLNELFIFLWHITAPATETIQDIYFKVQAYFPKEVMQDFARTVNFATKSYHHVLSIAVLVQPTASVVLDHVSSAVNDLHNKGIAYTENFLRQLLGVEVIVLTDQVGEMKSKFLSAVLFALWLLVGFISIFRMSYKKFLAVMSGMFLLHSYFGPMWCIRRLAFLFGLCLWTGSIVTNKPIPAAITGLIVFILNGMRAEQKKVDMPKEESHLQECNNNDMRIEKLERKMDLLLTKMEHVLTKLDMIERVINQ